MSDRVEATTRAVKVEALKLCSAYRIMDVSKQAVTSGAGSSPKHMRKKFALKPSAGSGGMRSRPRRRRKSCATMTGSLASMASALARLAAGLLSSSAGSSAPRQLTAVRSMSIGWQVSGSLAGDRDRGPADLAMGALPAGEGGQLAGAGQVAVPDEVSDFLEAAAGGQVLDGVAAVGQGVGLRDDAGDRRGVGDDSGQAFPDLGLCCGGGGHGVSPGISKPAMSLSKAA